MFINDKGWPLGQAAIQARYQELILKDTDLTLRHGVVKSAAKEVASEATAAIEISRSQSVREVSVQSRSLQRASRRATAMAFNGKAKWSQSAPHSSPSSPSSNRTEEPLLQPHHLKSKSSDAIRSDEDAHSSFKKALKPGKLTTLISLSGSDKVMTDIDVATKKKRPTFLAKQFGILSNGSKETPRRNIKFLGRVTSDATIAASAPKVVSVNMGVERVQNSKTHEENKMLVQVQAPISSVAKCWTPEVAVPNVRLDSLSRSSLSKRSGSTSERYSYSDASSSSRSLVSNLSIPETVLSSTDNVWNSRRMRVPSRTTSISSRDEWGSLENYGSFDPHGELDIAGLSLAEGRDLRLTSHPHTEDDPPDATNRLKDLQYSPEATNSEVEIYHSRSSSSCYSSRSSLQSWAKDYENTNHVRQYHHNPKNCLHDSSSSAALSPGAPPYTSVYRHRRESSPRRQRKLTRELSRRSFHNRHDNNNDSTADHHRRNCPRPGRTSSRHQPNIKQDDQSAIPSKVVVLLGKYGNRKGLRISKLQLGSAHTSRAGVVQTDDDVDVPLDSISPQEAVAVFQDEVARMMLEEGDCDEVADIEEFLDGYMRLTSPFYLEMVEVFFRVVCYDCYKRPLHVPTTPPPPVPTPGWAHGESVLRGSESRRPSNVHS